MAAAANDEGKRYRFAFVMEQNLGHRTHYQNLKRLTAEDASVQASWLPLAFEPSGLLARLPYVRSNWSARASLMAWAAVRRARRDAQPDAVFYHTQVTALLSPLQVAALPTVISLDATPLNYDSVGVHYGHVAGGRSERLKFWANQRALARADALVTWCAWAKDSLVADYGIPGERVTVIAPGVDLDRWPRREAQARSEGRLPRLLFVGGDFARKGGEVLLRAVAGLEERCELHVVTREEVAPARNVFVYRDVTPNSETLLRLYGEADAFVFPSLGDCAPLAVPEAMAAGLPVIATRVGAIPEMVVEAETGLLVPAGDALALRVSIETLLAHPEARARMGAAGRRMVEADYDARRNSQRLLDVLKSVTERPRGAAGRPAAARAPMGLRHETRPSRAGVTSGV